MNFEPAAQPTDDRIICTQRGMAARGVPLYTIIKHIPAKGRYPPCEQEFRCVDLWQMAFRVLDQGCSYTQFTNEPEHLRCKGCGLQLSKLYLRSALLMVIEAIPPDYRAPRQH